MKQLSIFIITTTFLLGCAQSPGDADLRASKSRSLSHQQITSATTPSTPTTPADAFADVKRSVVIRWTYTDPATEITRVFDLGTVAQAEFDEIVGEFGHLRQAAEAAYNQSVSEVVGLFDGLSVDWANPNSTLSTLQRDTLANVLKQAEGRQLQLWFDLNGRGFYGSPANTATGVHRIQLTRANSYRTLRGLFLHESGHMYAWAMGLPFSDLFARDVVIHNRAQVLLASETWANLVSEDLRGLSAEVRLEKALAKTYATYGPEIAVAIGGSVTSSEWTRFVSYFPEFERLNPFQKFDLIIRMAQQGKRFSSHLLAADSNPGNRAIAQRIFNEVMEDRGTTGKFLIALYEGSELSAEEAATLVARARANGLWRGMNSGSHLNQAIRNNHAARSVARISARPNPVFRSARVIGFTVLNGFFAYRDFRRAHETMMTEDYINSSILAIASFVPHPLAFWFTINLVAGNIIAEYAIIPEIEAEAQAHENRENFFAVANQLFYHEVKQVRQAIDAFLAGQISQTEMDRRIAATTIGQTSMDTMEAIHFMANVGLGQEFANYVARHPIRSRWSFGGKPCFKPSYEGQSLNPSLECWLD
ncbi:MAG: hypothetical protein AB7P04_11520 [Bacteriovoracia bacterium]